MAVKQTNRRAGHDLRPLTVMSAPFGHHHDGKSRVGADVPRDSPRRGAGTTEPGGGSEGARQARGPPRRARRPRAEFPLTAISSLLSSRLFAGESMSPRASDLCFRHVFPWRFGASWRMLVVDFPLVEFCSPPRPPVLASAPRFLLCVFPAPSLSPLVGPRVPPAGGFTFHSGRATSVVIRLIRHAGWEPDVWNENRVGPQGAYGRASPGGREVTFVAPERPRPRTCISELPVGKTDFGNQLFKKDSEGSCWLRPPQS